MTRNLDMAARAWGGDMPAWIEALARECDATSQARTAEHLGLSDSTINTVLKAKYPAGTQRIEAIVRGKLMGGTLPCPVLGELGTDLCREWQDKAAKFHDTGQLRRRMYVACRACPHGRWKRKEVPA
jgi:hypothetical protein